MASGAGMEGIVHPEIHDGGFGRIVFPTFVVVHENDILLSRDLSQGFVEFIEFAVADHDAADVVRFRIFDEFDRVIGLQDGNLDELGDVGFHGRNRRRDNVVAADENDDDLRLIADHTPLVMMLFEAGTAVVAVVAAVDDVVHHMAQFKPQTFLEDFRKAAPTVGVQGTVRDGIAEEDPCPFARFALPFDMFFDGFQILFRKRSRHAQQT